MAKFDSAEEIEEVTGTFKKWISGFVLSSKGNNISRWVHVEKKLAAALDAGKVIVKNDEDSDYVLRQHHYFGYGETVNLRVREYVLTEVQKMFETNNPLFGFCSHFDLDWETRVKKYLAGNALPPFKCSVTDEDISSICEVNFHSTCKRYRK